MLEATLKDWKVWYSENRSEDYKVVDDIEEKIVDDLLLVRLWIAQDGKAPKGVIKYQSKVWKNKKSKVLHLSSKQKKYDYFFESAGPGCTFVFKKKSFQELKKFVLFSLSW